MDLHLKSLFGRFEEQFGSGPGLGPGSGACLMNVGGIPPSFIRSVYKAAAALYRTDPWRRLRPGHLFGVRVGKDSDWPGKKQPFPCTQVIGGDGGDVGFYMFRSVGDAKKMLGPTETNRVPNVELLRVTYQPESLLFPSNRRMIRSLSLEVSGSDKYPVIDVGRFMSSGELRFRNPTIEELRFVYASMAAFALLHPLLQEDRDGGPKWSNLMHFDPLIETVDVEWALEMAPKNYNLVAVTVSHPPGQTYEEKANSAASSTPTEYAELQEETFDIEQMKQQHYGVRKEEIKVEVEDSRYLIIRTQATDGITRPSKAFMRKFRLPGLVEIDGISAGYEDGVLTVTVPRSCRRISLIVDSEFSPESLEVVARAA